VGRVRGNSGKSGGAGGEAPGRQRDNMGTARGLRWDPRGRQMGGQHGARGQGGLSVDDISHVKNEEK
jgi:hypothetical protein